MTKSQYPTETHPWPPFIPTQAKILIMGTFPPKPNRWSMDFYYPNKINDFWRIMGLIFLGSKDALIDPDSGTFRIDSIKQLLTEKGIALHDTCAEVRRLRDNASDKWLEIVRPTDISALLRTMPQCQAIATTGEKAAGVVAEITDTPLPKMGEMIPTVYSGVEPPRPLKIFRMPSTSRAYPMRLEEKARYYAEMFKEIGLLNTSTYCGIS